MKNMFEFESRVIGSERGGTSVGYFESGIIAYSNISVSLICLSSSLLKLAYGSGVSLVVRLKVVTKTLKEGLSPLMMNEIKSPSSTGLPVAASCSAQLLAIWSYSVQVRASWRMDCSWHFK